MRILHVDHSAVMGGAERSVLALVCAQRDLGHDVCVAVGRSGPFSQALEAADVKCLNLNWSVRYVDVAGGSKARTAARLLPDAASAVASLRRVARRWAPDVVHVHTRKAHMPATAALARTGIPLVWHLRDDLPHRPLLARPIQLALRRADHAVALSEWIARRYTEAGAVPRSGRIGIVPSGVETQELRALPTPWLDSRRRPIVGFVGQIAEWKAPHLLIEAAELLDDLPGVRYRIVGDVLFRAAEPYGARLRERLERSSASGRVSWAGGVYSPAEALSQIDVLVHTSLQPEPFGRVLVEAMAARRPIVALPHGSVLELLDESCASIARGLGAADLAAAVRRVIDDRTYARRLADAAQPRAARYEPAAVARTMDGEYTVAFRRRRPKSR